MPDTNLPAVSGGTFVQMAEKFKDLDPTAFREFLTMFREEQDRNALAVFNEAYENVCAEILKVKKDKTNPLFRARYPSYEALWDAVETVTRKYGLRVSFDSEPTGNPEMLRIYIVLAKGTHVERKGLDIGIANEGPKGGRPGMTAAQAMGSTITYVRKYLLQLAFNLVPSADTDDDGNGAGQHHRREPDTRAAQDTRSTHAAQESRQRSATAAAAQQEQRKTHNQDRERVFLDEFQARCDGAMDQMTAAQIIMDDNVAKVSDWLLKNSKTGWEEFCQIRDAMTNRLAATELPTDPP